MATKRESQTDGVLSRTPADEPVFILRAQDKAAPKLVRQWAADFMKFHEKAGSQGRDLARAIVKHTEAIETAEAMEAWPNRKQAD
jgi:ribosome-binding protein aMBF1 (putative translation factor)